MYRVKGPAALNDFDEAELMRTDAAIAWWRAQHAYPLTMVNANLRHYVADYDSQVTQRLKKHTTMLDKLVRQPTMDLTRMEDIGGCRVTLPTLAEVDAGTSPPADLSVRLQALHLRVAPFLTGVSSVIKP
jgi:GTP pyrophosphokinase